MIKILNTDEFYKKSWLIVLIYNNNNKNLILTKSLAIKQMS